MGYGVRFQKPNPVEAVLKVFLEEDIQKVLFMWAFAKRPYTTYSKSS